MGWRSLYLSNKHHLTLSIDNQRISIQKDNQLSAHFRVEDINFILVDSYDFNVSGRVLEVLAKHNIPLVLTSSNDHMPCLQLANPYSSHHQIGRIVTAQSQMTQKLKLTFWKKIISYKIQTQGLLIDEKEQSEMMQVQALQAKSTASLLGVEGSWAKYYWKRLVDNENFNRTPKVYGDPNDTMNSFLNYTYAIMRARISSAISENGMLPLFSLFHRRDYNVFALSDDMIEPYRWVADKLFSEYIDEILENDDSFLTIEHKKLALSVLHTKVFVVSKQRSFSLDEAIRIGMRGLREAILYRNDCYLEDTLCIIPL